MDESLDCIPIAEVVGYWLEKDDTAESFGSTQNGVNSWYQSAIENLLTAQGDDID